MGDVGTKAEPTVVDSPTVPEVSTVVQDGEASGPAASSSKSLKPGKRPVVLQDQSSRMPFKKILVVYFGIGVALVVSLMDQTSTATAAGTIGTDLHGSDSISWLGGAYLVSNCALQMVYGRMSDIFGRKTMLQIAVLVLAFGNLLCGFAKTPVQLYVFRAIAGMGGGGVNGIAMVIVSDIVSLKDRGKYQGFVSAFTSTGNALGLFLGGGMATAGQWRWIFRTSTILGAIVIVIDHFVLPLKPVTGSFKTKIKQIDYLGIFFSAAATVLLLVPISGGGRTFAWNSGKFIGLLVAGIACVFAFIAVQMKFARLPILPMHVFKDRNVSLAMLQSFFMGMIFYGNAYYVPIFLQYVKEYTPLLSGTYTLVYMFPQAIWGIVGGFFISKTNHYKRVIVIGAGLWVIGLSLQTIWTRTTHIGQILGTMELSAIGIGWNLQTTLVAALATAQPMDRAVVTTSRNFFRTLGGAFGLAISNAIYNNVVSKELKTITALSQDQRSHLLSSALSSTLEDLPEAIRFQVLDAFASGTKRVYTAFAVIGGIVFLCSLFFKEVLFRKDSPELEAQKRKAKGLPDVEPRVGEKVSDVSPASTAVESIPAAVTLSRSPSVSPVPSTPISSAPASPSPSSPPRSPSPEEPDKKDISDITDTPTRGTLYTKEA